ncbi:hypothetical protein BD309DRAFT_857595 [Dichomitus squalens]|uniref:Uncharacterized protein n=2 Tax=Dichomitus squalens TaxID=114155 RepID=A0A4Q9MLB6_9APHY|nr:uncharacterized protein DICSQDRAFT_70079 [Dichomitus squalens LYAD-421 SS1]EJF57164.1 hypothetical protein DICSQDRAFT_70079 [Dichomitus squalens LYAD-421 SS1]TBU26786.1 hypothetical protein BD311DRAFT_666883 [Dichomitus squalens]TBU46681.1 hypothetical protein BD309DRAFT_857595 [Dichomitus squalens]TBU56267.1 hypothetical protein BD310DRAFT_855214 [Dichomitus squalens]
MSGLLAYLPHLLYSTALTSISMHHLSQRKAAEDDRAHVAAQISILEDLLARPSLPDPEFQRLWRLARSHDVWEARKHVGDEAAGNVKSVHVRARPAEDIGWREVMFGRRFDTSRTEELDRQDLARGKCVTGGMCCLGT